MANNILTYQSIPLSLQIDNYSDMRFEYNGYLYYDSFVPAQSNFIHDTYTLFVATKELMNMSDLNKTSIALYSHVENIKMFVKYITGANMFTTPRSFDRHRKCFICANQCSEGWVSNYEDIKERLDKNKYQIKVSPMHSNMYAKIPDSPLKELKIILKNYDSLDRNIKYLMRLNYEADMASDFTRNLIYGKVLEIIDALHPLHGGKDRRIEEFYGGSESLYGDMTIKKLMGLANNRAETRHYVAKKGEIVPHESLTYEELGVYAPLIDNLAINEVRMRLDLPMVTVIEQ
jgi:hypothetical protein